VLSTFGEFGDDGLVDTVAVGRLGDRTFGAPAIA
jgi:hypothetical protein